MFATWQLRVTLDSIRNFCVVLKLVEIWMKGTCTELARESKWHNPGWWSRRKEVQKGLHLLKSSHSSSLPEEPWQNCIQNLMTRGNGAHHSLLTKTKVPDRCRKIKEVKNYLDSLDRVPSSPERRHCCHPINKTMLITMTKKTRDPCCELFIVQGLLCRLLNWTRWAIKCD